MRRRRFFPSNCFLYIVKVVILHQHFRTPSGGGAIRSYYLAKALVAKGIRTVVITAHNVAGEKAEELEGISVHYLPVAYDNRFGFARRIISFSRFMIKAVYATARHRDADVCYAISTPLTTGWAARMIHRKYGVPYIFEVGDLWPDAPVDMGVIRNGLVKSFLYSIEKWIYESAAALVALSEPIREAILQKVSGKTVHVLPNMADTEFYKPQEKQTALERKFGVTGKFVVSYIGALGIANGLFYFLQCARASQDAGLSIHFIICGDGAMLEELTAYSEKLRLENLSFVPFQSREGVREVMNVTDANFICYKPVKILETGSPNKYFDGLAAGKLTVVNFGGWVKEEIERVGCGIYVDPEDPGDFVRKIERFLRDSAVLKKFQDAGRALAEEKYSRSKLGEIFAGLIVRDSVADRSKL